MLAEANAWLVVAGIVALSVTALEPAEAFPLSATQIERSRVLEISQPTQVQLLPRPRRQDTRRRSLGPLPSISPPGRSTRPPSGIVTPAQSGGRQIPKSQAARIALSVVPGRLLSVELSGGVYVVKVRGNGRVQIVRVDAENGQVIGY